KHSRIEFETAPRSDNNSDRRRVPRTFLNDVCANRRVDSCVCSTLATDMVGLKTR
ncbi:unnamed protein product, partial [Rotaria sp. Silwood2]